MANLLTLARVLLVFVVIAVWARHHTVDYPWLDLAMVPVLAWAIFMDGLDGWGARRMHTEAKTGALFDIAGDRIVELALWTFFAIHRDEQGEHYVSFWVPIIMITRTVLTDFVRSAAFEAGKTPFGREAHGMQSSAWAYQLTASRWSRAMYGGLKAVCFCALGLVLAWPYLRSSELGGKPRMVVDFLVYATVVISVIRGIPVLWEGRRFVLMKDETGA